jgi:predicted amidophosphoribosyltransferase
MSNEKPKNKPKSKSKDKQKKEIIYDGNLVCPNCDSTETEIKDSNFFCKVCKTPISGTITFLIILGITLYFFL